MQRVEDYILSHNKRLSVSLHSTLNVTAVYHTRTEN